MLALLGIALLAGACSPVAISLDYDPSGNFVRYASFDWLDNRPGVSDDVRAAMARDGLFSKWVRQAVAGEMAAKGMKEDPIDPDLLVIWQFGENDRIDVRRFGYVYAAHYGDWSGGIGARYYRQDTLVLDLVDARTMRLVWRGAASGARDEKATPEAAEERVREAVGKLLSTYPPK